ncbi:hypothetical protein RJ639_014031 [Escallonia herrerae]|uniref:Uncharacterized protein n=1 Tax=Escallonia herrerae TaxID=1293975 RepID=A0AA88VJ03_9ASTE|nr:hypothetical protein RJ639_014031 [Escallonia herrerae]
MEYRELSFACICFSWFVRGWFKESLGDAVSEQPILVRRIQKGDNEGELKIVSTNSCIRLVEAQIEANLSEFLDLKDKKEEEAQLVFWENIDEQNSQFSPLFFVRVSAADEHLSEMQRTLAALCIEAADRSFATKMASKLASIIKESFKDAFTIESYAKQELVTHDSSIVSGLTCESWEDLGGDEICLNEGNKPASVSHWISSGSGEGLVMVIPSHNDTLVAS